MNDHRSTGMPGSHDSPERRFDHAARALHADALTTVSPIVRSRLQQARRTATLARRQPRSGIRAWAGSAAVLALALGVGLQFERSSLPNQATTVVSAQPSGIDRAVGRMQENDADVSGLLAALDENPDFYLWLAANDGALSHSSERYP